MARGWESKAVEDQIGEAQARKDERATRHLSLQERERQQRKQSLLLSRAQILNRVTNNPRYRAQLQSALDHIEAQLQEWESSASE